MHIDERKRGLFSNSHSVHVALGVAAAEGQASEMTPSLSEPVSLSPTIRAGVLRLLALSKQLQAAAPGGSFRRGREWKSDALGPRPGKTVRLLILTV